MRAVGLLLATALIAALPVHAFVPAEGYFIAFQKCQLFQSKNTMTNPGNVSTDIWRAYRIIGLDAREGHYYQVRVEDETTAPDRWVARNCGLHVISAGATVPAVVPAVMPASVPAKASRGPTKSTENVLALSWQSAFCEIRAEAKECTLLNDGALPLAEIRLSVHGLWPQPRGKEYCGVSDILVEADRQGRWSELPPLDIPQASREALASVMPGTMSFLDRHEWTRHGTCYGDARSADQYVADTLYLTQEINDSEVVRYLARMLGEEIRTEEIGFRFDEAFGDGAGMRIEFGCIEDGSRTLLQEIRVHLSGEIGPDVAVSDLLLAADPVAPGCRKAIIDPFGLQ